MILLKSLILVTALTLATTQEINKNEHYDDQIAMESQYDDVQPNYAVLPKHIFNEGKPFLVGKDPVSGAINFNIKKLSLDNYKGKDDLLHKKDIDISLEHNQITPNFHDFLNLPVKYTSSNSVYPLVSSSYANLKYQGNNKNFTSNHKNFTTTTTKTTTSPSYFTNSKTSPKPTTTKLYPKHTIKTRPTTVKTTPTTTTIESTTTQKLTTTTTTKPTTQKRYETLGTRQQFTPSTPTKIISTTTPSIRPSNFPKDSLVHKFAQEVIEIETEKPIQNEIIPLEKKTTEKIYFTKPTTFKPLPTTTSSTPTKQHQIVDKNNPDTMSLSELLNSLAEDEKSQNFIPYGKKTTTTTASTTTQPPTKKTIINENNYVKFEAQQPNLNMVQFPHKAVSSMNNIVISPDQNSATFVLGSQQSVGAAYLIGSSDKEVNMQKQGTVINEPIQNPQGFTLPAKAEITDGASVVIQPSQEIHVDPNQIRFPVANEFHIPVITGTYNNNNKPIALPQQNSHVIFPPIPENNKQQSEQQGQHVVFNNNRPFPPKEVLSMQSQPSYHQLPESLTPPMNEENFVRNDGSNLRPGFPRPTPSAYMFNKFTRQPNNPSLRPNPDGTLPNILPQFRPNAVGHGHGHHPYNNQGKEGNNRIHPGQSQNLPPPPPHFRRVDNHHPQQPNIRQPISGPQPPLPPQFNALRRQQTNLNPNRFNNKMAPAPEHQIVESNRRYYQIRPAIDRVYGPPIGHQHIPASPQQSSPPKRFVDGYAIQRQPQQQFPQQPMQQQFPQQPMQQQFPQQPMEQQFAQQQIQQQYPQQPMQQQYPQQPMQQQYPQQQSNFDETKPDFENEDLFRNPPQINQRPIDDNQQHKIEPVVTLQMIQSKKNLQHDSFNFTTTKLINEGHIPQSHEKNPLYVVYPVKSSPLKLDVITATESNGAVVIGQRGEQPPLPPSEIGMRNDYQNTPFTIIHNEQEPILMAKQNLKQIKPQFPYQLEKVDPLTVAELDRQSNLNKGLIKEFPVDTVFNIGEAPIDAIGKVLNKRPEIIKGEDNDNEDEFQISSTLTKVTRKPIAIAYTPTEPPPNRYYNHYGGPNFASPANEKSPTETAYNHKDDKDENGFPSRGDHYEQDFQAPFFPSISIGGNQVTNSYEGWAVVTPQTAAFNSLNKNLINRSDEKIDSTQKESEVHEKLEATTKKFNLDSFQPEFEGGFKPIFPDIKNGDVQTRHSEVREESPTQTEKQISVDDKKISSTSTTTTTTTEKPAEKKKEIDSLEALFGLDDDYEYDDITTTSS